MVVSPLWWKKTSKVEQTGTVDLVVTLSPQFPLWHFPSLHLLPSSFSRQCWCSCYPSRVKMFHVWGKSGWRNSNGQKRTEKRTLCPLPVFIYGLPITRTSPGGNLVAATIIIALLQILHRAWFSRNWAEFCSTTTPHAFALVPWNKKSLWRPCVSWRIPFQWNLWST